MSQILLAGNATPQQSWTVTSSFQPASTPAGQQPVGRPTFRVHQQATTVTASAFESSAELTRQRWLSRLPHRWSRVVLVAVVAIAWGASFLAALQIARCNWGHWAWLCGPWGCLPQTAPLVSVHVMWLTLLIGATWLGRITLDRLQSTRFWAVALVAIFAGLCVYLAVDLTLNWNERYSLVDVFKRFAFVILTSIDLPWVQSLICCLANWIAQRRVAGGSSERRLVDAGHPAG